MSKEKNSEFGTIGRLVTNNPIIFSGQFITTVRGEYWDDESRCKFEQLVDAFRDFFPLGEFNPSPFGFPVEGAHLYVTSSAVSDVIDEKCKEICAKVLATPPEGVSIHFPHPIYLFVFYIVNLNANNMPSFIDENFEQIIKENSPQILEEYVDICRGLGCEISADEQKKMLVSIGEFSPEHFATLHEKFYGMSDICLFPVEFHVNGKRVFEFTVNTIVDGDTG